MLDPDVDLVVVVVVVEVNHGGVRGSVVVVVVVVMPIRQPIPPTTNVRQPAASGTNNPAKQRTVMTMWMISGAMKRCVVRRPCSFSSSKHSSPPNTVRKVFANGPSSELCREQLCTKSGQWRTSSCNGAALRLLGEL